MLLTIIIITILLNYRFDFLQISNTKDASPEVYLLCVSNLLYLAVCGVSTAAYRESSLFIIHQSIMSVSTGKDKQLKSDARPLTININELHRIGASNIIQYIYAMVFDSIGKTFAVIENCLLNTALRINYTNVCYHYIVEFIC